MKQRIIEVALGFMNICAALFVFLAVAVITTETSESGGRDFLETTAVFLTIGLFVLVITWGVNYIITARKADFTATYQLIFGIVPPYFWFMCFFAYSWGLVKAILSRVDGSDLFLYTMATGIGNAIGILILGAIGRFYRPNKLLGHFVGTCIVSIFTLILL